MSKLAAMQARFQQKQMQEKEEKLLRLYENQQQRAFEKVSRNSSGSSSVSGGTSPVGAIATTGPGRVRQMFDERRQKAGIDRSYPLEPLKQTTRLNGHSSTTRVSSLEHVNNINKSPTTRHNSTTSFKSTVQRTISQSINGKPPKTKTLKQSSNAVYRNGNLIEEHSMYEESDPVMYMRQKELEMLMNNHNIHESLEDEELPDVGIDELDAREISPTPNENYNNNSRSNGSFSGSSTGSTPTKKSLNMRQSQTSVAATKAKPVAVAKRPAVKTTNSTTKVASSPKSTPIKQNSDMNKSAAKPSVGSRSTAGSRPATRPVQSAVANDNLVPCKFCQRRFAFDRVGKHEEICQKTLKKKRKTYDATRHRVEGTDAAQYLRKGPRGVSVKKTPAPPKTNWRRQHEEFVAAIRSAKQAQAHVAAGGKLSDLPPPPPSVNPDYVQCPHCGRRFNEAAAERHIPKCATMLHNKPQRLGPQPVKKRV